MGRLEEKDIFRKRSEMPVETRKQGMKMRLIDADKLIEAFEAHGIFLKYQADRLVLNWFINKVYEQPTVPNDMKWNPDCKDCIPEDIRECTLCRQR